MAAKTTIDNIEGIYFITFTCHHLACVIGNSLRHNFATHLLDKGTDIKYIKDLLGHFSIKTSERYLHVSKQQLVNIISPFDDLWKKEEIDR